MTFSWENGNNSAENSKKCEKFCEKNSKWCDDFKKLIYGWRVWNLAEKRYDKHTKKHPKFEEKQIYLKKKSENCVRVKKYIIKISKIKTLKNLNHWKNSR